VWALGALILLAPALAGCGASGRAADDRAGAGPGLHLPTHGRASATASPGGRTATPSATPSATAAPTDPGHVGVIPSRLEKDGTTITVGDPAARHTIALYEDPRCPYCRRFEAADGARLNALARAGTVRLQYTMGSFLDDNLGGGGSKRAVNALRAAVPSGRFAALHALLYAEQPPEVTDGFTVDELLRLAGEIPGLRGPAFDAAVRGQTYARFVARAEDALLMSGTTGTPTMRIDGKVVPDSGITVVGDDEHYDPARLAKVLRQHGIA